MELLRYKLQHLIKLKDYQMEKYKDKSDEDYTIDFFCIHNSFLLCQNILINESKLHIIVEFYKTGGFGDLFFGYKITDIIKQNFKNSKITVFSITPDAVENYKNEYIENIDIKHVNDFDIFIGSQPANFRFIIITLALETHINADIKKKYGIKHIFIDEYHGHRVKEGIGGPYNFYMIPGLGVNFCSKPIISCGIYINKPKEKRNTNKKFYFGYVSSAATPIEDCYIYLLMFILSLSNQKTKNISFEFVCNNFNIYEFKNYCDNYAIVSNKFFKNFQIFESTILFNKKNKIQITFHNYLPNNVLLKKIRNSLSPVLITGDQSLSEAISYNKLFFYQPHDWKTTLVDNIIDYIELNYPSFNYLKFLKSSTLQIHSLSINNFINIHKKNRIYLRNISTLNKESAEIYDNMRKIFDIKTSIISIIKSTYYFKEYCNFHQFFDKCIKDLIENKNTKRKHDALLNCLVYNYEHRSNKRIKTN